MFPGTCNAFGPCRPVPAPRWHGHQDGMGSRMAGAPGWQGHPVRQPLKFRPDGPSSQHVSTCGMTRAAVSARSGQTARDLQGDQYLVSRGARGWVPRLARRSAWIRVRAPCWPTRASSWNQTSSRSWAACREVFSNVSCASGLDFGCCGRTESRRNPRLAICLPTVRSCMTTPKRSSILRLRSTRRQRTTPSVVGSGPLRTHCARSSFCAGLKRHDGPDPQRFDKPGRPSAL